MRNIHKTTISLCLILIFALSLCACGNDTSDKLADLNRDMYEKSEHLSTDVFRGRLEPELNLNLELETTQKIDYQIDISDLTVESIDVSVGEHVKKGQILISFESENLKKEINNLEYDLEEKKLMLEHYKNLSVVETKDKPYEKINDYERSILQGLDKEDQKYKTYSYGVAISELTDDVNLAALYLEEKRERLNECQVKAEEDGTITFISQSILSGVVEPGATFLTEACGENLFTTVTEDDYPFKEGEEFTATTKEGDTIKLSVISTENEDDKQRVTFEPINTIDPAQTNSLTLSIKKEALDNVIYVSSEAVYEKNGETFVYTIDENGFLTAVYVTCGDVIGGNTVIKSGLTGNETLALL